MQPPLRHEHGPEAREELERIARALRASGADASERHAPARSPFEEVEPRLGLELAPGGAWTVTYSELEARGLAELVAECAPLGFEMRVGRGAASWEEVRRTVLDETGVDVSHARVRAGFTRGHLLEVVVALPSHGDADYAAELAVEGLLGEAFLDDWVLAIGTKPLLRGGPLRVVQASSDGEMHPLPELVTIAERAVNAVTELLPEEPFAKRSFGAEWTLLEMEPRQAADDVDPQAGRVLATTCVPELVKCALEGMPFHSRRFSRHAERFAWLRAPANDRGPEREAARRQLEESLDLALRERGLGAVVGGGFGARHDFVDLALAAAPARSYVDAARDPALGAVTEVARRLGLTGSGALLGFYDTRWSEARILL